nr:MAG TPA: hypothetical protein [Caudoviricetes sp.]
MKTINFEKYNINNDKILERTGELFLDRLHEAVGQYGFDLHNFLFNEGYAFIFDDVAESAVDSVSVWSAIRLVRKYELDCFGRTYTEIDPCKIANMLVYIYGEFLLAQVEHLPGEAWDRELTAEDLYIIAEQLEQWLEANAPTEDDRYTNQEIDGQVWDYYGAY